VSLPLPDWDPPCKFGYGPPVCDWNGKFVSFASHLDTTSFSGTGGYHDSGFVPDLLAYVPAPCDATSFYNGCLKYDHDFVCVSDSEVDMLIEWLDVLVRPFWAGLPVDSYETAETRLDPDKVAGLPWRLLGMRTKGDVMSSHLPYEIGRSWVASTNLKQELRAVGKDARLFMPEPFEAVLEGTALFTTQNMALRNMGHLLPFITGHKVPGQRFSDLVWALGKFSEFCGHWDIQQFDTRACLWFFYVIMIVRCRYNPHPERVREYYRKVYLGFASLSGNVCRVFGQRSGQVLTTDDNGFVSWLLCALTAIRLGWNYHYFVTNVKLMIAGDDGAFSTKDIRFSVSAVNEVAMSIGMYLESPMNFHCNVEDVVFLSGHPKTLYFEGRLHRTLAYNLDKLVSTFGHFKSYDVHACFQKLVMILVLTATDSHVWDMLQPLVLRYFAQYRQKLAFTANSKLLAFATQRAVALRLHFT